MLQGLKTDDLDAASGFGVLLSLGRIPILLQSHCFSSFFVN